MVYAYVNARLDLAAYIVPTRKGFRVLTYSGTMQVRRLYIRRWTSALAFARDFIGVPHA